MKMVELERIALALAAQHLFGKLLVLFFEDRHVLFRQRIRLVRAANDRLHTKLTKPEVEHMKNIVHKIGVEVRICTSDVIRAAVTSANEFEKFRNDTRIAALPPYIDTKTVVHVRASVETEDDVMHLFVRELDHVVIDKQAIRRQRETEMLAGLLFDGTCISDDIFDHLPIEKRFTAEEVDFKIPPRS